MGLFDKLKSWNKSKPGIVGKTYRKSTYSLPGNDPYAMDDEPQPKKKKLNMQKTQSSLNEISDRLKSRYLKASDKSANRADARGINAINKLAAAKDKNQVKVANAELRAADATTNKRLRGRFLLKGAKTDKEKGTITNAFNTDRLANREARKLNEMADLAKKRKNIAAQARKQRLEYVYKKGKLPPIAASGGIKPAELKKLKALVNAMELTRGKKKPTVSPGAILKVKPIPKSKTSRLGKGLPVVVADTTAQKEVLKNLPTHPQPIAEPDAKAETQFATLIPTNPKPGKRYSSYEDAFHDYATTGSEEAMHAAKALAMSEYAQSINSITQFATTQEEMPGHTERKRAIAKSNLDSKLKDIKAISNLHDTAVKGSGTHAHKLIAYKPKEEPINTTFTPPTVNSTPRQQKPRGLLASIRRKLFSEERKESGKVVDIKESIIVPLVVKRLTETLTRQPR